MKDNKLTPAQMEALAPYERHFTKATEAAWCPYPGQQGIDLMLRTWEELTGHKYGYKPGCPNCLLNLVRDLGTIYIAQKAAVLEEERLAQEAAAESEMQKAPKPAEGGPTDAELREMAGKLAAALEAQAKAAEEANQAEGKATEEETAQKASSVPAKAPKAPKASKTTNGKKNAPKTKK